MVESALEVKCEEDLVAKTYNTVGQEATSCAFTIDLFRQIVLPKLNQEVNEGEHFLEFRRVYNAIILAAYVRRNMERTQNKALHLLVDSNKPKSVAFTISDVSPLTGDSKKDDFSDSSRKKAEVVEHLQPDAAAFDIPENVEFFEKYIRLFRQGLFRSARSESGDTADERIIRVYFSGSIDFRHLRNRVDVRQR